MCPACIWGDRDSPQGLSCENLSHKVWRANETFALSAVCKYQERSLALVVGGKSLITADLTQNKGIHLYLEEGRGHICECQRMITNVASNAPGIIQATLSHWKSDVKRGVQCSVLFVAHCHVNYLQLLKPPLEHSLNNIPRVLTRPVIILSCKTAWVPLRHKWFRI